MAHAQTAPIPVEAFFEKTQVGSASISPDGKHVALTVPNRETKFLQLVVLNTSTLAGRAVASFDDADVVGVRWISDKRLIFRASDSEQNLSPFIVSPGLYAVDLDGKEFIQLAHADPRPPESGRGRARVLDYTTRFHSATYNFDSDVIYVVQTQFRARQFEALNLLKLDTRTGNSTPVRRPGATVAWAIAPDDVPRIAITREEGGKVAMQYLDGETWVELQRLDEFTGLGRTFSPVGFAPDGTLFATARKGEGTTALHTYDPKTKQLSAEPVLNVAGFDVYAQLKRTRDGLAGITYHADAQGMHWLDPKLKDLQAKVDKLLPGTLNVLDVPFRGDGSTVLVWSYSDAEPGQVLLFDTKTDKLARLARARPSIDPARMARLDFVRYKARDGLDIPAWLTVPKDGKPGPRPMVVIVHSGPFSRGGYWRWDADTQFLASRGYVVLEPEYRGSQGYGYAHFRSGWRQWGLAMQNDIADGTRWAIEKGIADPKRICITGANYGGYAALMGLVNDPDLYRCGISMGGITDLDMLYATGWSDTSEVYREFGLPALVGDRVKDAAQLKATSPVTHAARIKQPLLLVHGAADRRVPLPHGENFRDAVSKTNNDVEWVVYSGEGHGWRQLKTKVDFWTRVEKFLARNIGP